jgi:hypothetical protein
MLRCLSCREGVDSLRGRGWGSRSAVGGSPLCEFSRHVCGEDPLPARTTEFMNPPSSWDRASPAKYNKRREGHNTLCRNDYLGQVPSLLFFLKHYRPQVQQYAGGTVYFTRFISLNKFLQEAGPTHVCIHLKIGHMLLQAIRSIHVLAPHDWTDISLTSSFRKAGTSGSSSPASFMPPRIIDLGAMACHCHGSVKALNFSSCHWPAET